MTRQHEPRPASRYPEVVRAGTGDLDALSQVIAEAFHDLDPSRWLIADPADRRAIFPGYFRLFAEHAMAHGAVYTTTGWTAAALWIPAGPGTAGEPDDYAARLAAATAPWTSRFLAFDQALGGRQPADAFYHHLAMLAVRPDGQGQGIGTALLHAHHQILDRDGVSACLEAASPRSRQLYLRHGYADQGPPIYLPGGARMYPMWREPAARPRLARRR
jgi:GNAT superfamily N-acetyltransferase